MVLQFFEHKPSIAGAESFFFLLFAPMVICCYVELWLRVLVHEYAGVENGTAGG